MLELGFLGEQLNLSMVQGADFGPVTITTKNPDNSPVDYTGCTIQGQIRTTYGKHLSNIAVSMPNPSTGVYTIGVSAANTSKLPAGVQLDSPDSIHVWDLELVDSSGIVTPLYYGTVTVRKKSTKL